MLRRQDVPRHSRQADFEALFCLGPRERLLKTYSASVSLVHFHSMGKLWISTGAVCFSGGNKRMVLRFEELRSVKSGGIRSVLLILSDDSVFEISGLWHKEECLSHLESLWWNARAPPPQNSSPRVLPTTEVDDLVLVGSGDGSDQTHLAMLTNVVPASPPPAGVAAVASAFSHLAAGGIGASGGGSDALGEPHSPANAAVNETLDELDEVADLLMLPVVASTSRMPEDGDAVDQYGFPLDPDHVLPYRDLMNSYYLRHQEKMRDRWLRFLQKPDDIILPAYREELVVLLLRGIPPDLRPALYFRLSGARMKRSQAQAGYYLRLRDEAARRAADAEWGRAVEKDLLRTFPYHRDFHPDHGEVIPQLRRILCAYGLRNEAVQYCQGMNFVCGALLVFFHDVKHELEREEKVFWVMCAIVEDLLPSYFTSDMIGSMVDQSVMAIYCEKLMPRLYNQFKKLEYPISLVLCKWMNCLFLLSTPSETAARVIDVVMLLGSDALVEFSLGFLASFQAVLCQCKDLQEMSRTLDASMMSFYPSAANAERMQSFIGQLDRRELVTLRHRVFERAEVRLREHSTIRTLDRLRNLGSLDDAELEALEEHWREMFDSAPHKEGIDRETFVAAVSRSVVPEWAGEPRLLDLLFDYVNKNHSGVVSLSEWATLIELLSSRRGKFRLLYGLCGDKGEPAKVAEVVRLLSTCWRGREATKEELDSIVADPGLLNPEKFVRMMKQKFPEFITSLDCLKFRSK